MTCFPSICLTWFILSDNCSPLLKWVAILWKSTFKIREFPFLVDALFSLFWPTFMYIYFVFACVWSFFRQVYTQAFWISSVFLYSLFFPSSFSVNGNNFPINLPFVERLYMTTAFSAQCFNTQISDFVSFRKWLLLISSTLNKMFAIR